MAENTKIEWAHHTFNPWEGCQKVGPGCDNCYAEARNARFSGGQAVNWGPGAPRRRTSASNWAQPLKWNKQAQAAGIRYRVFCASLADVFDNEVDPAWRAELFTLIERTPHLDWLLLTKRIGNVGNMLPVPFDFDRLYPNVWIGVTIVNQEEANRDIPKLLETPAAKRFLSMEPLLGPVDLLDHFQGHDLEHIPPGTPYPDAAHQAIVDWIIVGGESGPHARPMHPDWARNLRNQCIRYSVPFLFKQWGEWIELDTGSPVTLVVRDGDPEFEMALDWHDAFLSVAGHFVTDADAMADQVPYRGLLRVGKKAAGRLLDGREWNEVPS